VLVNRSDASPSVRSDSRQVSQTLAAIATICSLQPVDQRVPALRKKSLNWDTHVRYCSAKTQLFMVTYHS